MENKQSQMIKGNNNNQSINKTENTDNSMQVNAALNIEEKSHTFNQVNIYNGNELTEQQVRKISTENTEQIVKKYFLLSQELADKRMNNFENKMIERFEKNQTRFECFKNPSFCMAYRKAQFQSAMTDNENTYETLCELLIHREEKNNDIISQTGIDGAIEIVNQLSDTTLSALTIIICIQSGVTPASGESIVEGLKTLDNLYASILCGKLPNGSSWLDQLDILKAIRMNSSGRLKKFEDILESRMKGFICIGIKKDSENYKKASEIEQEIGIQLLKENELLEGYYRLPLIDKSSIEQLCKKINADITPFSQQEKDAAKRVYDMYETDNELLKMVKNKFVELLNKNEKIKLVREWWNNLNGSFEVTAIGRVLGHANAQKCYAGFPPLD